MLPRHIKKYTCLVLLSLILARFAVSQPLPSESPRRDLWTVDRPVVRQLVEKGVEFVIDESRDRLYIGGRFKHVGPLTGPVAFLDTDTGVVNEGVARIDGGSVTAVAPDGSGGWYVGGSFQTVDGQHRRGLAHFLADGSLDPGWNPDATGSITDIEIMDNIMYVAGPNSVGGQTRNGIAAIDLASGEVLDHWIPWPNGPVRDIKVVDDMVYLAGEFTEVTSQSRPYLAAVDRTTGAVLPWAPSPNGSVSAIDVVGGCLYAGGRFTTMNGQPRRIVAAFDIASGVLLPWDAGFVGPDVWDLVATADALYVGGRFSSAGGQPRTNIAAIHPTTAAVLPFAPVISGTEGGTTQVNAIAVDGDHVVIGGHFTSVNGEPAHHLAMVKGGDGLDVILGEKVSVDGPDSSHVHAVGIRDGVIAAGGNFHLAGGHSRAQLAALRLSTGKLDQTWVAGVDGGSVQAMLLVGPRLYVAGEFTSANGVPRSKIAAFNADNGVLITSFAPPTVGGNITRLALRHNTLYVAGRFSSLGGLPRHHVGAINAITGAVLPSWDGAVGLPVPRYVEDMALSADQSILYVAGGFNTAGNVGTGWIQCGGVAAFNADSGQHLGPNLDPNDVIYAVEPTIGGLWAGGWFRWFDVPPNSNDRVTRRGIAKVAPETSTLMPWSIWLDGGGTPNGVHVLREMSGRLFIGGRFTQLRGSWFGGSGPTDAQWRPYLAAMDVGTSEVLAWSPEPNGEVGEMKLSPSFFVVGGGFSTIGGRINPYFAVFTIPTCPGDANGDGSVDAADLSVLLSNFGGAGQGPGAGDFNDDGSVDAADLSVLLGNFGASCDG